MRSIEDFDGQAWQNPSCSNPNYIDRNVAIIGCGNYAYSNIAFYLSKNNPDFLRYAYDEKKSRALSLCKAYGGGRAVGDWREILSDPRVKIVYIASNHASHAEYAELCIKANKHVHIEKPHVVSQEQLLSLLKAMRENPNSKVFLGFNRPRSILFKRLQDFLKKESGALMINWFIAGHEISDEHWYFDEKEGGRVLGNLCHWTDLTLHLVTLEKAFPCRIIPATPVGSKSDFAVSVIFSDKSCASITFSAKGHSFEGVREILNLHKGNLLATLTDFHMLEVDLVEKKKLFKLRQRDHGHEANLFNSQIMSTSVESGEELLYVAATAKFFLAIRQAIDSGQSIDLSWNDIKVACE